MDIGTYLYLVDVHGVDSKHLKINSYNHYSSHLQLLTIISTVP